MREFETNAVSLFTRNAVLEQEVKGYQVFKNHMKQEVLKYRQQIVSLQKQLHEANQKMATSASSTGRRVGSAGADRVGTAGGGGEELRLPKIGPPSNSIA